MGRKSKRKVTARIAKILPVQKVQRDSLQAKLDKEDQQAFIDDQTLSGFVREYVPGEFPEGHLTEEEVKNTKYVLVKRSRKAIGFNFMGKYPLTQAEFEYYQEDPSRMDELEPAADAESIYQSEE